MRPITRALTSPYAVAVLAVVAATALRLLLTPALGDRTPYATLFAAVLAAAWYGGLRPAAFATLLGAAAAVWLLLPPTTSFAVAPEHRAGLALYVAVGLGVAWMGGQMHDARARALGAAAEAARGREELRTTLASIGDAVVVTDARGAVVSLNPVAEALTGWPAAEAVGRPLDEVFVIVSEDTREAVESPVARVLREGNVVGLANHTALLARGGPERPIDDSAAPVRGPDGRLTGVVLVFRDVSERKRQEEAVRAQARVLDGILAASVDHVYVVNPEGRYLAVSAGGARVLGFEPADVVGRHWRELGLPAEVMEPFDAHRGRALATGAPHTAESAFRGADGATRHFEYVISPLAGAPGAPAGVVVVSRDVTDRKRVEADLRFQARVLESMSEGVSVADEAGVILFTNPAEDRMFGYQPGELVGRHVSAQNAYPAEENERIVAGVIEALKRDGVWTGEWLNRRKDGTAFTTSARITALEMNGLRFWVCVQADVTARKRAEAAAREAEARLRAVVDHSPAVIFLKDADGRYLLVNRRCEELARASGIAGPLLGRTDAELVPAELAEQFRRDDLEVLRTGRPKVFEESGELGGEVRTSLSTKFPLVDDAGAVYAVGGINLDITDRVRAEAAVRDSEQRFRALMEQAPFSVQVLAPDGRTVRANRAWEELWGVTVEQLAGYNILSDRQLEEKGVLDVIRRAFAGEPGRVPAVQYDPGASVPGGSRHPDAVRWVGAVVYPLTDAAGRVREVVLVHDDRTRAVRAEQALRESEATLRAFYDNAPVCMGVTEPTPDGDILHVYDNPASCRFFGIEPGSTAGRRALAELGAAAEVVAVWLDRYRASAAAGGPVRFEYEYRTPGGPRWLSAAVCPIGDGPAGRPRFCYVAEDVTERRARQEQVRQSEERLRLALEAGRMGVWDWDVRTNAVEWSDNLEAVHGLPPGGFDGTLSGFERLIYPDDRPLVSAALARALEEGSGYDIEFRNVWADGSVHWMAGKGTVFTAGGRPVRMIGIGMDVTARKRAEQDARFLAAASAELAALVDDQSTLQKVARLAVPAFADWCAVDMLDEAGALRRVAVAHVDPAKVELAHDLHRRFPPDPAAPQGVWNVIRAGRSELVPEITDDMLRASDPPAELLAIMRALGLRSYMGVPVAARGRVLGAVTFIAAESGRRYAAADLAVAEDLAHRAAVAVENARLYQALREADRRKDEFLGLLGHELRNPMAPVRSGLEVLKRAGADPAVAARVRDMMERQVEHMVRLVDDLLDVSRIVRGKIELRRAPMDLRAATARAVEAAQPFLDADGHRLAVEDAAEPLWVDGDLVRLTQVVGNLLNNAAKYSEPGGSIRVSVARDGDQAVVRVRDRGIGIRPEVLPRVFDMFFQADRRTKDARGGLGIGLSLVKGLVEMHGGSVEAHSDGPGQGSEFAVRLPLWAGAPAPDGAPAPAADGVAAPAVRKVLVVDDNADAADSLAELLGLMGLESSVAYDGPTALTRAAADPPALAFLDLGMPGMDGFELARRFRERPELASVVLVALTGWGQPDDRRRTRDGGFDHHLVKPVEVAALNDVLARAAAGRPADPDPDADPQEPGDCRGRS